MRAKFDPAVGRGSEPVDGQDRNGGVGASNGDGVLIYLRVGSSGKEGNGQSRGRFDLFVEVFAESNHTGYFEQEQLRAFAADLVLEKK